ncbi:MAG TPA: PA domain-containing protein [Actinomycetota bacterium]|nr:PA domain-containing protein [Actinomycetota bacterium]
MSHRLRRLVTAPLLLALTGILMLGGAVAYAIVSSDSRLADDGAVNAGKDVHSHGAGAQHGPSENHLPPVQKNVDLIGFTDLFAGGEQPGRIGDVSAKGNFAYLTKYWEPECDRGGIQVVDISDPAKPKAASYIPSHLGTFAGEGSQVVSLDTKSFKGDVLIYQNEICPDARVGIGGVTLVDVTNPLKPKKLVEGFGDFTVKGQSQSHANQVHSAFGWVNTETGRAYVVMTDDEEATDTDIIDITNPSRPTFVAEYDFAPESRQPLGAVHGDAVFIHDEIVKKINGRYIGLLSYWDGGYIQVDLTDPTKPKYIGDTEFAAVDPVLLKRTGTSLSPEGNAHEAEFTRDNRYFVATDEDFDPYRVTATITDGPFGGSTFTAVQGSATPPIDEDTFLKGDTRGVGLACEAGTIPAPDAEHRIAVIERGVCDFQVKIQNVEVAGYVGAIVFNRTGVDGCETLINMLTENNIPAMFVSRTDGFRILGASLDGYTCSEDGTGTTAPGAGTDGSSVDVKAIFDGWGYIHLFDAATFKDLDQFAIPEAHDPAYAQKFGDLSVHEVTTDPDKDLTYSAYYAGGLRVLSHAGGKLREVGAFIAGPGMTTTSGQQVTQHGNNFWGIEVHKHPNGQKYVLASDRDSGLWIFQPKAGG